MPSKYASRRALNRDQLYAIGFVAAEWSNLEFAIMMALGEIVGLKVTPSAALGGLFGTISASTDALVRLSSVIEEWNDVAPELERICKEINNLATERNLIVHGTWDLNISWNQSSGEMRLLHVPTVSGTSFPRRGKKVTNQFAFSSREMREVAYASHEATQALLYLVWRKAQPLPDTKILKRVLARQVRRKGSQPPAQPQPRLSRP